MAENTALETDKLTLGHWLTTLYLLANQYCHSRLDFFRLFFAGYHKLQGEVACEEMWVMPQSTVSRIMGDDHGLTWRMRQYYILNDGDAHLRQDVQQYVHCVVQTAKQHNTYLALLANLVEQSTNLAADDRAYITAYNNVESSNQLVELIYRTVRTLIRYV